MAKANPNGTSARKAATRRGRYRGQSRTVDGVSKRRVEIVWDGTGQDRSKRRRRRRRKGK